MSPKEESEEREYYRIKDQLPIEIRIISHEEFLERQSVVKYNPVQVMNQPYEIRFLRKLVLNEQQERDQTYAYLQIIDKKLDVLLDLLAKPEKYDAFQDVSGEVEVSGSGLRFNSESVFSEGQYVELHVMLPRFPYPKISVLGQVLRDEPSPQNLVGFHSVVVKFLVINEEDRDLLISYVFMKDRERLRLQKEAPTG
jgi:hypothetical protein